MNIRKDSVNRHPHLRQVENSALQEPYFYRNQGSQRQYMFRFIDGLYCNNFYPLRGGLNYSVFFRDFKRNSYHHFRTSCLWDEKDTKRSAFSSAASLAVVSPIFFPSGHEHSDHLDYGLEYLQVLILEGYHSGTFPTDPTHPFTLLLRNLIKQAIPIVLVTRDGLIPTTEPYKFHLIDGFEMPVLPLFGVIAETAAPLVSTLLEAIPKHLWSPPGSMDARELLGIRIHLLDSAIRRRQAESPDILNALLGNIVDHHIQLERFGEGIEGDKHSFAGLVDELFRASATPLAARIVRHSREDRFDQAKTVLMSEHFLWILEEVFRPYELAGCGPDGLAVLNEMGFVWGTRIIKALKAPESPEETGILAFQLRSRQEYLVNRAQEKIGRLVKIIRKHGVADISIELKAEYPYTSLVLDVTSIRHAYISRQDELYAVIGSPREEAEFLQYLGGGADLRLNDDECEDDVEGRFAHLFRNGPLRQLSPLDWFLFGTLKAAVCASLRDLYFDTWVEMCDKNDQRHVLALRQSVNIDLISTDESGWHAVFSYQSRDKNRQPGLIERRASRYGAQD
jgi:hypothetical protein